MQIPGKKESTKKNQKIKPKKKTQKVWKAIPEKRHKKSEKYHLKIKYTFQKNSPNAGTGGSLVLYSYKEKHERHRKNIIKKEVRKMFDKKKVKTWNRTNRMDNDDMPDLGSENTFEQCVSEMALAGFTGSEVGNKYPKDTKVLKHALDLRGVEICNQWFSAFLITKPFEEVEKEFRAQLAYLKEMGAKVIGASEQSYSVQGMLDTPIFGHKYVMNDEEWKIFCDGMNKLGKIAKEEYGIALTFHHHMGTVVQNADEVERMMDNTDPEYVSLLFDTGHFAYCGEDPLEMVKKYADRIKHVHLKDIRKDMVEKVKKEELSFLDGVRMGTFTVPGDGDIDFDPIFKVLEESGYTGYMVVEAEQDPAKANPLEYALKARKFISEKTGL